jgi:photosystem II stability/assembly factor-like uncharacterized protein
MLISGSRPLDVVLMVSMTSRCAPSSVRSRGANHAVVLASDTGNDGNGGFKPSRISFTANGGKTWQRAFDANASDFYNSMGFFDRRRGLAFSDPVGGKFPILETGNGGHKWKLADPEGCLLR